MRIFRIDLHIHSALSACADDEMTPPAIVEAAQRAGLEMIAICDHNAAGNTAAIQAAAGPSPVVLAGMEITTAEEAHVVGLFPCPEAAERAAAEVRAALPHADALRRGVPRRGFGAQRLMTPDGVCCGLDDALLSAASALSLSDAVDVVRRHGGLAVAAHVDRPSFSVPAQLGMMPADVRFDAIEISAAGARRGREAEFAALELPILFGSDSHSLEEIGAACTMLRAAEPSFAELALALQARAGREVGRA
ncbi:MAG: PHP domain-containing protein [Candidatus Brocadiaceae bacterium]|nr:PHP domain-containing protein [Candidatus Brocadiaceae bacterium]